MSGRLVIGNCLEKLRELDANSIHCCVTSPPYYGLRKYAGEQECIFGGDPECVHVWGSSSSVQTAQQTDFARSGLKRDGRPETARQATNIAATDTRSIVERNGQGSFCLNCGAWYGAYGLEPSLSLYVQHTVEIFREVWRVLRDDGTLWVNLGDSYAGSGKGLGSDHGKAVVPDAGYGEKSSLSDGLKPKDLMMVPARVAIALQEDGWYLRQDCIWFKPNPMPESVTDRPTTSHEHIFLFAKSERYFYDQEAVREKLSDLTIADKRNGSGRHTQASEKYQSDVDGSPDCLSWYRGKTFVNPSSGRNLRSVWTFSTQGYAGAHFATFPQELPRRCIMAGSPTQVCAKCGKGWERVVETTPMEIRRTDWGEKAGNRTATSGTMVKPPTSTTLGFRPACTCGTEGTVPATILDPFAGSGTTLFVAEELGRTWIGIDISEEYKPLIENRLKKARTPLAGLAL